LWGIVLRPLRLIIRFDGKRFDGNALQSVTLGWVGNHLKDMSEVTIDSGARIGHVHLKVADLERALKFYCGVLGFELMQRFGNSAAFISAGGYHHHIGLNTWESAGGAPPAPGTTGLYHLAIVYPTQAALADALQRLMKAGVPLDGAADHGVSEALYLRDPDGNGVELYWDRPREEWPRSADGELAMFTRPPNLQALLASVDEVGH
jgi:catechol 2,3-dioxygenase